MAESSDFSDSFKKFFNLKNLGLWWAYPKSDLSWTKDNKEWALHYEIDRSDVENGRDDKIKEYLAQHSLLVDNFFLNSYEFSFNVYHVLRRRSQA